VTVEILSTHNVKELSYQIFNFGKVIDAKTFSPGNSKKFEVKISPQSSMVPKSEIIFFYITRDGEIISDKISLELEKTLPNDVRFNLLKNLNLFSKFLIRSTLNFRQIKQNLEMILKFPSQQIQEVLLDY
jgi:hypothetical protein